MNEDQIIEVMARAMAVAEGHDPDEVVQRGQWSEHIRWQAYAVSAKCQRAAHLAMIAAESAEKPQYGDGR